MDDTVVLVTGASRGIGAAVARDLVRAGCRVVACSRASRPADLPSEVEWVQADVALSADRERLVQETLERFGRVDVLVNNAGYGAMLAMEDTSADALRAMLETNLVAPHELARLVLPSMRRRGVGRIVNVASIAGHVSVPFMGAYCATKFALRAATMALHNEVRPFGVHACLVEPGVIATGFGTHSLAETERRLGDLDASVYAPWYRRHAAARQYRSGRPARLVVRRIRHAVLSHRPRLHYFTPWQDAKLAHIASRLLPDAFVNALLRIYFRPRRMARPPQKDATK